MKSNKRLKTFNTEMKREMKTPVKELYEKLWEADKDRFAWNAILMDMLEKEKEVAQQYAEFAIECDREKLPVLEFDEWMNL